LSRFEAGLWLHLLVWQDRAVALAAAQRAAAIPVCAACSASWATCAWSTWMSSTWAQRGDVEAALRGLEDRVYGLALRALWHPRNAQDVARETLLAIPRGLPGFRGGSALETWTHRTTVREVLRHRGRGCALTPAA